MDAIFMTTMILIAVAAAMLTSLAIDDLPPQQETQVKVSQPRAKTSSSGADAAFDAYTTVTGLNDPFGFFQ